MGMSKPRLKLLCEKCIRFLFDSSIDYLFWFCTIMWYLLSVDQSRHHPEHDGLLHEHRWTGFSCEGPRRRQASLDLGWSDDDRLWEMINDNELVVVSFVKMLPFPPQVWSAWVWWVCHLERQVLVKRKKEQDPVSTMQKTGWTNHSAFQSRHSSSLVWFGPVWCGLTVGVDHLDAVTNHLLVYLAILV